MDPGSIGLVVLLLTLSLALLGVSIALCVVKAKQPKRVRGPVVLDDLLVPAWQRRQ